MPVSKRPFSELPISTSRLISPLDTAIASYQYVGSRPARRVYPTPVVTTDSAYDNLGRITAVDAGTSRAKFRTSYVSNEHNIDRQYLETLFEMTIGFFM
jgi:hypothetical protein